MVVSLLVMSFVVVVVVAVDNVLCGNFLSTEWMKMEIECSGYRLNNVRGVEDVSFLFENTSYQVSNALSRLSL